MSFSSVIFLFYFLPVFFLCYYAVPAKWKNGAALIGSLVFYAWGEPFGLLFLLASIAVCGLLLRGMGAGAPAIRRKRLLILGIVFHVGMLAVFKYAGFFGQAALDQLGMERTVPQLPLPVGISFFTFQILTCLVDVYRGQADVPSSPMELALYVALFPKLTMGPIVRYQDLQAELRQRHAALQDVSDGIFRFVLGMGKKVLLANELGALADSIWNTAQLQISAAGAWLGLIAYALQIYFDFSGYSDMAIGLGRMMGFHFKENFVYPYLAKSVSEFWRRWHISLGSWFREYVYIPLGGSRVSRWKLLRNLMVVWLLTGLWHGANWTFLLWGLYYGVLICLEKLLKLEKRAIPAVVRHIGSLFFIVMGWVLFRADTVSQAVRYVYAMFGGAPMGLIDAAARLHLHDDLPLLLAAAIGSTPLIKLMVRKLTGACSPVVLSLLKAVWMGILLVLCTMYLVNATYNPFIYARF